MSRCASLAVAATGLAVALTVVLAGCSSSGSPVSVPTTSTPATTGNPPSSSAAPTTAPLTTASSSTPRTTAPRTTSAPPRTSTPPAPPSSTAVVQPRSTCTNVMVRVIDGSGASGREFAALQFVNNGTTSCVLNGYPTVTLLLNGKAIGSTSTPASGTLSSRTLAPGDTAESQLNDYVMNCNAKLSDTVRVQVPGSDIVSQRPGQLRACTVKVSALGAPE